MGKKKFFDKKKSATFQLLARNSSDPHYDESVPGADRVFIRVDNNPTSVSSLFPEDDEGNGEYGGNDPNSISADASEDYNDRTVLNQLQVSRAPALLPDDLRKEILELGFPDDGYNYLMHLREIKNSGAGSAFHHNPKAKLEQLPNDVKAYDASKLRISEAKGDSTEKSVLYNIAAKSFSTRIQKVIDPEVAKLLDDSDVSRFGSDSEDLDEDFVVQANLPEEIDAEELEMKLNLGEEPEVYDSKMDDLPCPRHQLNSPDLDGVAEVTNHQSEAVDISTKEKPRIWRLLDEQFDLLEHQEYGTDSEDDYDGFMAEEDGSLADKLKYVRKENVLDDMELVGKYKVPADLLHDESLTNKDLQDSAAAVIRRCVEYAEKYEDENEDEDVVIVQESSDESESWDCETIVSTYTNLDNHPGKIGVPELTRKKKLSETVSGVFSATNHVISLKGKEKLPVDYLPRTRKDVAEKMKEPLGNINSVDSMRNELHNRKQHCQETKEEKKERKAAVKEERREARRMKKEMRGLFKCETQRAQIVAATSGPSLIHLQ